MENQRGSLAVLYAWRLTYSTTFTSIGVAEMTPAVSTRWTGDNSQARLISCFTTLIMVKRCCLRLLWWCLGIFRFRLTKQSSDSAKRYRSLGSFLWGKRATLLLIAGVSFTVVTTARQFSRCNRQSIHQARAERDRGWKLVSRNPQPFRPSRSHQEPRLPVSLVPRITDNADVLPDSDVDGVNAAC